MIRKSDKGPRRSRPPRTKQPRNTGGGGGGGGSSSSSGCFIWSFAPPLCALVFLFTAIREVWSS
jgi:hypothetical protein